jgi:hypothetical protein
MYLRVWVLGEHVAEFWSLKPSPRDEPPPEVPILFATSERAPQTQPQRKIEEQNRICHGEADWEGIVGTQVPIHDPARLACELPLHLHPLFPRQRRQAGLPKMFIQLDDGKTNEFAKSTANGRFSSPTSVKNNNALHCHIFMPALFNSTRIHRLFFWRKSGSTLRAWLAPLGPGASARRDCQRDLSCGQDRNRRFPCVGLLR